MALTPTKLRRSAELVDTSELATWFDERISATGPDGERERRGRRRLLSVRTLLIGIALAALDNRELHLVRVREILAGLSWGERRTLGIPTAEGDRLGDLTDRQVSYLWCELIKVVDPSPHFNPHLDPDEGFPHPDQRQLLQRTLDRIVGASLDDRTTDVYAVDWTYLSSWARLRRSNQPSPDPDANHIRYENKSKTGPKYNIYGYAVHAVVRSRTQDQDRIPYLCERITLAPAATDPQAAALPLIEDLADEGNLHRLLADRGYSMATADRWAGRLRELGVETSFDFHSNQRGAKGTYGGALAVDGQLYCPAMPENLIDIKRLDQFATVAQREQFFTEIERRDIYALKPFGREKPDKARRMRCPAAAGVARCPLKPESMDLPYDRPTIYPGQDLLAAPPVCCDQQTISVPVEIQSDTRQTPAWGTREWFDIYARFRPAVESFFSVITDAGKEHMARGRIKMMGLAKTSVMVAFWTAAANWRLRDAFDADQARRQDPDYVFIPRQPRRNRAVPFADRPADTTTGADPPRAAAT